MGRHTAPEWPESEPAEIRMAAIREAAASPGRKWPPLARVLVEGDRKVLRLFRDSVAVYVDWTDWRLGYKLSPAYHRVSLLPVVVRIQRHRETPAAAVYPAPARKAEAA